RGAATGMCDDAGDPVLPSRGAGEVEGASRSLPDERVELGDVEVPGCVLLGFRAVAPSDGDVDQSVELRGVESEEGGAHCGQDVVSGPADCPGGACGGVRLGECQVEL